MDSFLYYKVKLRGVTVERTYTIETRISLTSEIKDYLNQYVMHYSKLYRTMWHQVTSLDFNIKSSSYLKQFCIEYGVLKRTANTIYRSIQGKKKALMELKKLELTNLKRKVDKYATCIENLKCRINNLKPKVTANTATEMELQRYRNYKRTLYQKQRRYNRLKQQEQVLTANIANKQCDICFGSKKQYKAQWQPKENGYKTKLKWHNIYIKQRDKCIEYLGSSDESCGNQMCQLMYLSSTDNFALRLRKENKYVTDGKCVLIDNLDFKYMREELISICEAYNVKGSIRKPLTCRFLRRGTKWYLQVIFSLDRTQQTRYDNGILGLDFNNGFIEATETDRCGNIMHQYHFGLRYHGCGNKAKSEMSETVARIVNIAANKGKDIAIESLNFNKKKATVGKNKAYNKMLHTLDYSRYTELLQNACHRKQVGLIQINPAYTSVIGEKKYGKSRKLNRHQAASYVIARLGQGYTDTYEKYKTIA